MQRLIRNVIIGLGLLALIVCLFGVAITVPACFMTQKMPADGITIDGVTFTTSHQFMQYERLNAGHRIWFSRFRINIKATRTLDYVERRTFFQWEKPLLQGWIFGGGLSKQSDTFALGFNSTDYTYDRATGLFSVGNTQVRFASCFGFPRYQRIAPNEDLNLPRELFSF